MEQRRWPWWIASGLVTGWLLWMTLRPNQTVAADLAVLTTPAAAQGLSLHWLINIIGNIIVFVPLGASLVPALQGGMRRRLPLAVGGGAVLSLFIELAQITRPTRVSSWEDWALNVLGTLCGASLAGVISRRKRAWRTN